MVNPYFNGQYYLTNNPDVAAAYGLSTAAAEQHYLNYGAGEALSGAAPSRKPAPWFDIKYYLDHNPDLVDAGLNANDLFTHFTTYGMLEGRSPSASVGTITEADLLAYANANADLRAAFGIDDGATSLTPDQADDLTQHFYQYGYKEGRPAPLFGSSESDDNGQYFELTSGTDRMEGTAGDDHFDAFLAQNPMVGTVSNTLSSADHLKGGAGSDSLYAELIAEGQGMSETTLPVQPRTTSIETIEIEARDFRSPWNNFDDYNWDNDDGRVRGEAVLDAKYMYGVERIGSKNSDGHLKIQNLNTLMNDGQTKRNTDAITITMDHTENLNSEEEGSDLIVLFDENYLISGQAAEGRAFYWLLDQDADLHDLPLLTHIDSNGIMFQIGDGPVITVASADAVAADNHPDFVAALNARLAIMLADGEVPAGTTITLDYDKTETTYLHDGSVSSDVPAIVVTSGDGSPVTPIGYSKPADTTGEYNVWAIFDKEYEVEEQPVTTNIELHKVGRGGEGGDLIVGGKDVENGKGIEVFNVKVMGDESKPSHLGVLNSTGQGLRTVNITTDENVTGEKGYADLTIEELGGDHDFGDTEAPETDVQYFDSTGFKGDLTMYTDLDESGNGEHIYKFGAGVNKLEFDIFDFGGIAGDSLSIATGNNDDTIEVYGDADLESLTIDAGDGDNTIFFDAHNYNQYTGGEGAIIRSGSGNDAIYLNSTMSQNIGAAIWLEGDHIDGGGNYFAPLNITNTVQESYKLFGATMQVSVDGVQSEWVKIDYNHTTFRTSREDIRQAFQDAINSNSALVDMVEIVELTDGTLAARSLVNGISPVTIDIQGPVGNRTNINNGNPLGNSGPVLPGDGAGWDLLNGQTHLTEVTLAQLANAWKAWYPNSTGFAPLPAPFGNSGNNDFDGGTFAGPVGSAADVLEAMQGYATDLTNDIGSQFLNGTTSWDALGGNVIDSGAGDDLIVLTRDVWWFGNTGNTVKMTADDFGVNTIVNFNVGSSSGGGLDDNDILDFTHYLDSVAAGRGSSTPAQAARTGDAVDYTFVNNYGSVPVPNNKVIDHNSMHLWDFSTIWNALNSAPANAANVSQPVNFESLSASDLTTFFNGKGTYNGEVIATEFFTNPGMSAQGSNFLIFVGKDGDVTFDTSGGLSFDNLDGTRTAADDGMFKVFEGEVKTWSSTAYTVEFIERGTIDLALVDIGNLTAEEFGII